MEGKKEIGEKPSKLHTFLLFYFSKEKVNSNKIDNCQTH